MTRRIFLGAAGALGPAGLANMLAPVRSVAASAKPVRIRGIDIFNIEIPTAANEVAAGVMNRYSVAKVETDAGVNGYSFAGLSRSVLPAARGALVGKDLFAVEEHLKAGLINWGALEHAVWDAIGKVAGTPVYRLLGGAKSSLRVYLTCVWPGPADQSQVPYKDQVAMAVKIKNAGFHGMKIRAWRPRPLDDAEVCGQIMAANGRDFHLMFDRTAHAPGKVWDYGTAEAVARALEKNGAYWLEEPFSRDDFQGPARLAREMDLPITGGEGYRGLDAYRECLTQGTYDILQPDCGNAGGILTVRKVSALCEAFHKPCIQHGAMGLRLAGWLQASASYGAPWQELALITPPLLPEEQWAPALKVLNSKALFTFQDGEIQVPQGPGLGLEINEEALTRHRQG